MAVYFHTIILLDIALFDDFLLILRMENVCINLIFSILTQVWQFEEFFIFLLQVIDLCFLSLDKAPLSESVYSAKRGLCSVSILYWNFKNRVFPSSSDFGHSIHYFINTLMISMPILAITIFSYTGIMRGYLHYYQRYFNSKT